MLTISSLRSLTSLPFETLLPLTRSATSSRVLDTLLSSPTTPSRSIRAFILRLIGHFPQIADDRIGSRVAERAFATADPFLKDKIAASVFDHQDELQRSAYAHFLARKMELPLWGRKREEWKLKMGRLAAEEKARAAGLEVPKQGAAAAAPAPVVPAVSKKRERRMDDIDEIFKTGTAPAAAEKASNGGGGADEGEDRAAKRARKEARRAEKAAKKASTSNGVAATEGLGDVLAAIKATV